MRYATIIVKFILSCFLGIFLNVKFGKYGKINYQTNILHFQQPGFTFFLYKKIQDCKVFLHIFNILLTRNFT